MLCSSNRAAPSPCGTLPNNPARSATIMGQGGTWSPLFGHLFCVLITGAFTLLGALFVCLSFGR